MNFSESFKSIISAVAPVLGSALGGPLGGAAASSLATTLLGKPKATKAELEQAIKSATPEQLIELKRVDNEFDIRMQELGLDLERINQQGVANARAREIAVKDKIPAILAILLTLGFFGILGYMFFSPQEVYNNALMAMLGALATAFLSIINYYFGSSSGSAKKNDLLAGLK